MVLINGEKTSADGMMVKACIDERGYNPLTIAVELNEEILPKAEYAETVLKDGDVLEQGKKCSRRLSSATEKSFKRNFRAQLLLYADWEDSAQIFL